MRRRRPYTRAERIGGLMKDEVERIVQYELRSKLARHVEITSARLSGDLGHLKVQWVMRDGQPSEGAAEMLDKAASYVGRVLRDTYQMRKTPKVVFHYDAEHQRLKRVAAILQADRERTGQELGGNDATDGDNAATESRREEHFSDSE